MLGCIVFSAVLQYSGGSDTILKSRLMAELREWGKITTCYVGPVGKKSESRQKADSLTKMLTLDELCDVFRTDTNRVLRYYTFCAALWREPDSAEALLKVTESDGSTIFYTYGCIWNGTSFRYLLYEEFANCVRFYRKGGNVSVNCYSKNFSIPGRTEYYRLKKRTFRKSIENLNSDERRSLIDLISYRS